MGQYGQQYRLADEIINPLGFVYPRIEPDESLVIRRWYERDDHRVKRLLDNRPGPDKLFPRRGSLPEEYISAHQANPRK